MGDDKINLDQAIIDAIQAGKIIVLNIQHRDLDGEIDVIFKQVGVIPDQIVPWVVGGMSGYQRSSDNSPERAEWKKQNAT